MPLPKNSITQENPLGLSDGEPNEKLINAAVEYKTQIHTPDVPTTQKSNTLITIGGVAVVVVVVIILGLIYILAHNMS